eukprot:TRINITY_DN263_c0_g1_i1.p2 TRINITY_DN263_c0_g1~~TRINITY_DN263_c0_g1_i1.p2  ORF type:complete len:163 (+),score=85.12 TRINITY_DN263_c0_g1_i1:858-1346(+)
MVQRFTYRRRHSYNTRSNKTKIVRAPGGKLVLHYREKIANGPKCGDCGTALAGIPCLRPRQYATLSKRQKTVTRAYGGSRCGNCVYQRVLRAFLIEEQSIVKKVLKQTKAKAAKALKSAKAAKPVKKVAKVAKVAKAAKPAKGAKAAKPAAKKAAKPAAKKN